MSDRPDAVTARLAGNKKRTEHRLEYWICRDQGELQIDTIPFPATLALEAISVG